MSCAVGIFVATLISGQASAQTSAATTKARVAPQVYPSRPIRMIVPFSPGGTSDTLARILGQQLTAAWGQQVVVDSRPGASGIIGTEVAARAPADGYTLMHGNLSQFAINPSLFSKLSYETLRDFAPLSLVGSAPQLLVVNPGIASKSVAELVQLAKAKPGTLNYGSGGAGTLDLDLFLYNEDAHFADTSDMVTYSRATPTGTCACSPGVRPRSSRR
jgi:tripartite-type tricarboxylate transporter receptor subunit TctC